MHKVDGYGATVDNKFTEGDPPAATPATDVTADWLNAVQGELVAVIEAAGIALDKANNTQLLAGILALAGGGAGGVKVITNADSPYAVLPSDNILLVDCTTGAVQFVLLDASNAAAKKLTAKKIDATANAMKAAAQATQYVEGIEGGVDTYDSVMPGEFMTFVPDGVDNWHRVG